LRARPNAPFPAHKPSNKPKDRRLVFDDAHAGLTLAAESDRTPIVAVRFGRRIHVLD
jgi:hypothetical protein